VQLVCFLWILTGCRGSVGHSGPMTDACGLRTCTFGLRLLHHSTYECLLSLIPQQLALRCVVLEAVSISASILLDLQFCAGLHFYVSPCGDG